MFLTVNNTNVATVIIICHYQTNVNTESQQSPISLFSKNCGILENECVEKPCELPRFAL